MDETRLDGVTHRFVELPRLRMHVAEAGAGEPVLLLHGFPQHWWEWRGIVPHLTDRYRVICPDLRGAGRTDAPSVGYTRDQLLADVVALLDELQIDRVRVIGHDWGALVGFQLCLRHPERVRAYLSLATPPPFIRIDPRMLPGMWRLWFQYAIATPMIGPRLLGRGRQRLPRYLLRSTTRQDAFSPADLDAFIAPLRQTDRAKAASALYRNFILPEFFRIVAGRYRVLRLTTPTRVLYGADDKAIRAELLGGYEDYSDELAVELVPGAAHFIADERPDFVVDRALSFFERV